MNTKASKTRLAPLVQTLTTRLPSLVAVYRFGSFGTINERAQSDIDIGLQAAHPLDPMKVFELAAELATLAHREVDLVDMLHCSTVMRAQIVATGEIIYCGDNYQCENFATTAFSQYAYLNETRRGILADIQLRGQVHG